MVRLPGSLPDAEAFDLGACLGVPAVTAHRALTSGSGNSRLGPDSMTGQVVLVQGGAGAVGNAAIQLAAWSGATVLTTVSSDEKAALATAAGAHHVVNYRAQDAAAAIRALAPDGVDLIAEVSPAVNNELDVAVAGNGATIAIYANNGGDTFPVDIRRTFGLNLRYQFLLLYTLDPALLAAAAEDVTAAVAAGALRAGREGRPAAAPLPAGGDRGGARRGRAGRDRQGADRHRLSQGGRASAGAGSLLCTIGPWPMTKCSPGASGT